MRANGIARRFDESLGFGDDIQPFLHPVGARQGIGEERQNIGAVHAGSGRLPGGQAFANRRYAGFAFSAGRGRPTQNRRARRPVGDELPDFRRLVRERKVRLYDAPDAPGTNTGGSSLVTRRDDLIGRRRWQFAERAEQWADAELPDADWTPET